MCGIPDPTKIPMGRYPNIHSKIIFARQLQSLYKVHNDPSGMTCWLFTRHIVGNVDYIVILTMLSETLASVPRHLSLLFGRGLGTRLLRHIYSIYTCFQAKCLCKCECCYFPYTESCSGPASIQHLQSNVVLWCARAKPRVI